MFQVSTGEKMIDLNDAIASATSQFLASGREYGDLYDADRVSHAIGDGILDFLEALGEEDLLENRALSYYLNKRLTKIEPVDSEVLKIGTFDLPFAA